MACVLIKKAEYSVQVVERSDQALVFKRWSKSTINRAGYISALE